MRWSVGLKLYAGFGLVLAVLVVTGVFAITQLSSVGTKGRSIYDDGLDQTQKAATLRRDMLLMRASILGYVAAPADKRAEFGTKITDLQTSIEDDIAALRAEPNLTEAQDTNLDTVEQNLSAKVSTFKLAQDTGKQPVSLRQAMNTEVKAAA